MSDPYFTIVQKLKPEDWKKPVDDEWTVKDVVAHLVGWKREAAIQLPRVWMTKRKPWFVDNRNYDEFNKRSVEQFSKLKPDELLQEWKYWSEKLQEEKEKISEEKIKENEELFDWFFDEEDSHYERHMAEIKEVISQ